MFRNSVSRSKTFSKNRFYSLKISTDKLKTYQNTVLLPKTSFPSHLGSAKIVERDERIQNEAKFLEYYNWQRENLKGEFVLHDGPPYANGKPHIGHAINKILKDIILRSQTVQGKRVHFVPGWDCHGLPIELAALEKKDEDLSAEIIRERAREVALKMSSVQMEAFKQWGVMADWTNQCYFTFDTKYIVNQLQIFWDLFEKGLIYYDLKPIFWSPSSMSALAEAELIYNNHSSPSLIVRLSVIQDSYPEPLYLLVWTTTPWTLPLNKAVYCSSAIKYSLIKISTMPGLYVIATDLIPGIKEKLKADVTEESEIPYTEIVNFKYRHPWNPDEILRVFESPTIKLLGTGLLHSVPGHGHEDYVLGLANNLKVECFVDESGCYTSNAGENLAGMNVLKEGSDFVVEQLSSEILINEKFTHNYPHDWRTKEPVIIRASKQWFIDSERLKDKAIKSLDAVKVPVKYFKEKLKSRPYWCLSRQRKWGVPVPAFFHKKSGRPLISKSLVHHICQVVESSGADAWWTESVETLFPRRFREEFFVSVEDVVKGEDIMDIWFDSGVSWSYALNGKKSELYLEGEDQYSGWFQSSLLTSVAVRNEAPFKKIMTHGFAVDEQGKKMSKSLGNVVDPETVVKGKNAFGVDTLRWFVASHSHNSRIPVCDRILSGNSDSLRKIRLTFRFLLAALNDVSEELLKTPGELTQLDRFMLNSCYQFYYSTMDCYNSQTINKVCLKALNFVPNEISSRYITSIKDRLYCDEMDSARRRACQYTLAGILDTLCCTLAPITPHLIEEVYSYHPLRNGEKFFYNKNPWSPPPFWKDDSADAVIELLDKLKSEGKMNERKDLGEMRCTIQVNETEFDMLKRMQGGEEESKDSELTEILQVAEVRLRRGGSTEVTLSPAEFSRCLRCRRRVASGTEDLCERCSGVVSGRS